MLTEWRCSSCPRMLAKVRLVAGTFVQIKCKNCHTVNTLDVRAAETAPMLRAVS